MKKLITLAALVTMVASINANARTPMQPRVLKADLNKAFLDKTGPLGGHKMAHGEIIVNEKSRELTLYLELGPDCKPNMMCPRYLIGKIIKLQNMKGKRDACNIVTYTAERNKMPVDGIKEETNVVDSSLSTCMAPFYLPYINTQVTYKTMHYNRMEGKLETSRDMFYGQKLEVEEVRPLHIEL